MRNFIKITTLVMLFFATLGAEDNKSMVLDALIEKDIAVNSVNADLGLHQDNTLLYLSFVLIIFLTILVISLYRKNKKLSQNIGYQYIKDDNSDYELMEKKELFLAKVSHELTMPINAIIGLSSIVLKSKLDTVQYNNISKIIHFAEMISDISNDILDISKIDAGKLKMESIEFNINEVLEDISNMTALKIKEKDLELVLDVDKSVPTHLIGDPLRLNQILINLIDNAIKFSDNGIIKLNVNTVNDDFQSRVGLAFHVIDNGIGMSDEVISNIFKDFCQGDESVSRLYGGIGLGLSISKQLVDMMDGTIDVKSKKGVGTEFIVKINFAKYEINNKRSYRLPSKSLMSKKAMIVDSNRRSVESLSNMLKYFHYNVEVVSSLEWAKERLSQVTYDMIFIDENSLLKSSVDMLKDIKNTFKLKVILIQSIYFQNSGHLKDIEEIDKHLLKPFNQNVIYNLILEIYGHNEVKTKLQIEKEDFRIYQDINILVAEDNDLSQKILRDLLSDTGFKLIMTRNGDELLNKLNANNDIDLILIDLNMDIENGCNVAKEIRKTPKYDDIPIYALTSQSDEEHVNQLMQCGMQGYFAKPIIIDVLYENLFNIFSKKDKKKQVELSAKRAKNKSNKLEKYIYTDLDVNSGLKQSGNDSSAYDALLDDFIKTYDNANVVLDTIVKSGNYNKGEHFVHTLKTHALHLGGHKLYKSAEKIEESFIDNSFNKNSILFDRLKRDIDVLLVDIKRYRKESKK